MAPHLFIAGSSCKHLRYRRVHFGSGFDLTRSWLCSLQVDDVPGKLSLSSRKFRRGWLTSHGGRKKGA